MIFIIPYKSTVKKKTTPWVNYGFVGVLVSVFVFVRFAGGIKYVDTFILDEWSISAILGHMWLHISAAHLICNLVYLWVFGNGLCAGIGNLRYLFLYIGGGTIAAVGYLLFDGRPCIGASGAISSVIVALCLLFPYTRIYSCVLLLVVPIHRYVLMGIWFIAFKFVYELLFSLIGFGRVAYINHLSGIVGTGLTVYLLIRLKVLKAENRDQDLLRSVAASL